MIIKGRTVNNLSIKAKLWLLSIVAMVGFFLIFGVVSSKINNIEVEYKQTESINNDLSSIKSILIGGLMINSATNVFVIDNSKQKPIKTMEAGLKKVNKFANKLKKVSIKHYKVIESSLKQFNIVADKVIRKAKENKRLWPSDAKKLLKPWRALKFKLRSLTPVLKKDVKKSQKCFEHHLDSITSYILVITILILIIYFIVSFVLRKTILDNIMILLDAIKTLNNSKDKDIKITLKSNDELNVIASELNIYLDHIREEEKENNILIQDAQQVLKRVKHGWYSQTITATSSNPILNNFKEDVNEMIKATKQHFIDINVVLEKYAHNDYTQILTLQGIEKGGVFELLINDINKLRDTITAMLIENQKNGNILNSSSVELLDNVGHLSNNATQAAVAIEETAANLEDITSNISASTQKIVQMTTYAHQLSNSSNEGKKLASQTTEAMNKIDDEVNAISEAIAVIDQIAFQTNILSLNAAVEAATAGEAGKGFAVVAQEVRNLASRSADAANDIKTLVDNATNRANHGKEIADKMIEGYGELNHNISNTIDLISTVEEASKKQLKNIEQINHAISDLDKQTQQNAIIASKTKTIAEETDTIAKVIVENTNNKKFDNKK